MYKKTIALALLETSFRIPKDLHASSTDLNRLTPRLTQICLYLDQNYDRLSAFDDLAVYVSELAFGEAKHFVEEMIPKMAGDVRFLLAFRFHASAADIVPLTPGQDAQRDFAESVGAEIQISTDNVPANTLRSAVSR